MTKTTKKLFLGLAAMSMLLAAAPAMAQTAHAPAGRGAHGSPAAHASTAAHTPAARPSTTHASSDVADGVVNIQTATAEQLQLLPGIGPSKAEAIVTYRHAHPFQRVEDILRVRGIGRATFRRLRSMITVSGGTTMTTDVRAGRAPAPAAADEPASSDE